MPERLIHVDSFLAYTAGILVYFLGVALNDRIRFLRQYNIPEPVTGGLLVASTVAVVTWVGGFSFDFDLETRDRLLVYFFTCIGINAKFEDLVRGGRLLMVLLGLTLSYIFVQNLVGVGVATVLGEPGALGLLVGSVSLIGGHGTAIAWAPELEAQGAVAGAPAIGAAAATLGLVAASLLGGPIARILMRDRRGDAGDSDRMLVGVPLEERGTSSLSHRNFMAVLLVIHVAVLLGYFLREGLSAVGFRLPLFVCSLVMAIVLSNSVPRVFPRLTWPARSRALAVVSDFSLSLFLSMSLMSIQLSALGDSVGIILVILGAQIVAVVAFTVLVLYPMLGRGYLATVLGAGFAGFTLGATPTAVANMSAVTRAHGPAPDAFIMLPLVGAFFVDVTNSLVIQLFLRFL